MTAAMLKDTSRQERTADQGPPPGAADLPPPLPATPTERQKDCLEAIITAIEKTGGAPSLTELQHALGLKSRSTIHSLLKGLEERGWIHRPKNRTRAITVLNYPEDRRRDWLVFSVINGCWWRSKSAGYTRTLAEAGRYTRREALLIAGRGRDGWTGEDVPTELPVRIADAQAAADVGRGDRAPAKGGAAWSGR